MSETMSHDAQGNEWAKLSELEAGHTIKVDGGFTCLREDTTHKVHCNTHGLFVECDAGQHYLEAQADDGEHLVGIYKA